MDKATIDVFGDTLEVNWDGSVWISPSNGQQHSRCRDAMETELRKYIQASGDDPDDEEFAEQIVDSLENIKR